MKSFSVKNGFGLGIIVFAVAAIIALPVRTLQFFTVLEGDTGFFNSADWSVYFLYAVLTLTILFSLILGIIKRKNLGYSLETVKRPGCGILSLVTAIGVVMDAVNCISKVSNSEKDVFSYSYSGQLVVESESIIFIAEAVFAIISAVYFLALGIGLSTGKSNGSNLRLISLAPVIWSVMRMIYRFTRTISYLRISDLTFEMVMLMFMILFFMAFAQVNSQVNGKSNEWKLAAYGLPAALLALVCFVPRFIVTLIGRTELLYSYSAAEYCDFAVALFILATVITRLTDKSEMNEADIIENTKVISGE